MARRVVKTYDTKRVAQNIRILMTAKGLNQSEFAKKIGVSATTLYRLLNGLTDWDMSWVVRASKALGASIDEIFLGKIIPNGIKDTEQN